MLTILGWIAFVFAFMGASAIPFGLFAGHSVILFRGMVSLAIGLGLFAIWTTAAISGFMGALCAFSAAFILISLVQANHPSARRHDARPPLKDFVG